MKHSLLSSFIALAAFTACASETTTDATPSREAAQPGEPAANPAEGTTTRLVLNRVPWMGCVATVRGALKPMEGVADVNIQAGDRNFTVTYDEDKVDIDNVLAALEKAGEPAELAD